MLKIIFFSWHCYHLNSSFPPNTTNTKYFRNSYSPYTVQLKTRRRKNQALSTKTKETEGMVRERVQCHNNYRSGHKSVSANACTIQLIGKGLIHLNGPNHLVMVVGHKSARRIRTTVSQTKNTGPRVVLVHHTTIFMVAHRAWSTRIGKP